MGSWGWKAAHGFSMAGPDADNEWVNVASKAHRKKNT